MNALFTSGARWGLLAGLALTSSAYADTYALSADGATVVRLVSQGTAAASTLDTSLLNAGWTSAAGTGGSMSVSSYTAGFKNGMGGAEIKALYDNASAPAAGSSLEWVQVITTNAALGSATSPYLDNALKPTKPFYSLTAENKNASLPASKLNFYDYSKRDPAMLATTNPINWDAKLYPVVWDGAKGLTVQDGVSWGWTMKKATIGTNNATFFNPGPASATVSGVGSNNFGWGIGDPSSLSFASVAFDTAPNTPFKLGTLSFHNGVIARNSGATSVDFKVSVQFDNVPEKNFDLSTTFTLINTPNTNDPIASADTVTLGSYGFSFNVLEQATATVDLMATITSSLSGTPSGSANPTGADSPLTQPFDGVPQYRLQLVGLTNPSAGGFVTIVPEPAVWLLWLAGGLLLLVRRPLWRATRG